MKMNVQSIMAVVNKIAQIWMGTIPVLVENCLLSAMIYIPAQVSRDQHNLLQVEIRMGTIPVPEVSRD